MIIRFKDIKRLGVGIFLVLAGVLAIPGTRAATYYIDYVGGSDANIGNATNAAWQHCPGDPMATANPLATTLNPGDTVFFKGGVTYQFLNTKVAGAGQGSYGIGLKWNGTSGNPITYATAPNWGGGQAVFTDDYSSNSVTAFYNLNYGSWASYLTFSNLDIGPMGGSATLPADPGYAVTDKPGGAIGSLQGFANIVVEDCYIHNCGYTYNTKPMSAGTLDGSGFSCMGLINSEIISNEFALVGLPINVEYTTGWPFTSNDISFNSIHTATHWCMYLAGETKGYMNYNNVHNNTIYDFDTFYAAWTGYGSGPHQDGIFIFRGTGGCTNGLNNNFYNNHFYSTTNGGGATACIYLSSNPSANVYNNVFDMSYSGTPPINIAQDTTDQHATNRILNNTFIVNGNLPIVAGCFPQGGIIQWDTNSLLDIRNNLFYDASGGPNFNNYAIYFQWTNQPPASSQMLNFNGYYTLGPNNLLDWVNPLTQRAGPSPLGQYNLAQLRGIGYESNGFAANPGFVNVLQWGTATAYLDNYQVLPGSQAVGAGTNLTNLNLPGLDVDMGGNPRSATTNWTIGAYGTEGASILSSPSQVAIMASTTNITSDQSVLLTWSVANVTNVVISSSTTTATTIILNESGTALSGGSTNVAPGTTTTYQIVATGANGSVSTNTTINFTLPPPTGLYAQ